MITQAYLKEILDYNSDTGIFTWKESRGNVKVGDIAGCINNVTGYRQIRIEGNSYYYAHRLAWFYTHGEWPPNEIDHINHEKDDNRLINLRCLSHGQNIMNRLKQKNNTSGRTGVYWNKRNKKWKAQIGVDHKQIHLGYFNSQENAVAIRKAAEKKYFGEYSPS